MEIVCSDCRESDFYLDGSCRRCEPCSAFDAYEAALSEVLLYAIDGTPHLWNCLLFSDSYGLKWCTCQKHQSVLRHISSRPPASH